ncbi:MAG: hypothetical protein KBT11_08820 [Treponema sp.]|nr:hypothetical protein [Candidatus Treponema equifaecale]
MDVQGYIKAMARVFESNDDYAPAFCFEDWQLFSVDRAVLVKEYAVSNLDQLGGSDVERIAKCDPAIVLVGQRDYKNHSYKIYFDGAFGGINRHILTIDGEWVQVECNFSSLMAFADFVAERHDEDIQKLKGGETLQISWLNEACLNCKNY